MPKTRHTNRIARQIACAILTGKYKQGAMIDTSGLEKQFSASRTIIREALRLLTAKGLLEARPRAGTYVCEAKYWSKLDASLLGWRAEIDKSNTLLHELLDLRLCYEPNILRLSARRINDTQKTALKESYQALYTTPNAKNEAAFYHILYEAAQNPLISTLATPCRISLEVMEQQGRYERFSPHFPANLLECCDKGDGETAYKTANDALIQSLQNHA